MTTTIPTTVSDVSPTMPAGANVARTRVIHLVRALNYGGLEKVVYDLVRLTDQDRFDVLVTCLGEAGALGDDFARAGIAVESLGLLDRRTPSMVRAIAKYLKSKRPDILHTHNPSPHLVGALAARLARVPVVIHTKHGRNYPTIRKKVLQNRFASWLTDAVIAVSNDSADVARDIERVPHSKVHVIRNGIDLDRFHVHREIDRSTVRRAIHVARLIYPTKDQETLLRAVRLVADKEPAFLLDIVGDGPHRARLEALCDELHLRRHVKFHGFRDDVHVMLARAEFFVLSSVKEGLSITLLEAAATGLPIVATRVGGNPEVVLDRETGLLVPPESPESLAAAMLELLACPEAAEQMGTAGRNHVQEVFDLKVVVAAYEAQYMSLLHSKQGRGGRSLPKDAVLSDL